MVVGKRGKKDTRASKKDRISLLPDCLLVEIISRIKIKDHERRMTTKEVIRTTATISKRWQHLWTLLPNRTFIDEYDLTNDQHLLITDLTDYISFIDITLTQCPTHVKLTKFKLYISFDTDFNPQFKSQAISWIHHAIIHRNVQKVNLRLWDTVAAQKFTFDDALFFNNTCITSMKLCDCLLNPPNGVISWENLKILRLWRVELDEDMIENILSGSPCLEGLEFLDCYGYRRIDITSKSLMMFTLAYGFHCEYLYGTDYIDGIEINAPHLLALTIQDEMYLKKLLLRNVSSLIQAKLEYQNLGVFDISGDVLEEEMLKGLLESLSHVNDVTLIGDHCLEVLSRLEAKGFQYFEDTDDTSPVRDSV